MSLRARRGCKGTRRPEKRGPAPRPGRRACWVVQGDAAKGTGRPGAGGGTGQAAAPQRTRARGAGGARGEGAPAARRAHKGGGREGSALTGRAGAVHARGRVAREGEAGEAALQGQGPRLGPGLRWGGVRAKAGVVALLRSCALLPSGRATAGPRSRVLLPAQRASAPAPAPTRRAGRAGRPLVPPPAGARGGAWHAHLASGARGHLRNLSCCLPGGCRIQANS